MLEMQVEVSFFYSSCIDEQKQQEALILPSSFEWEMFFKGLIFGNFVVLASVGVKKMVARCSTVAGRIDIDAGADRSGSRHGLLLSTFEENLLQCRSTAQNASAVCRK